jgi:hypothetical protein
MIWDIETLQLLNHIDTENTNLKQTYIPFNLSADSYFLFYLSNMRELNVLNLATF